MPEIQQLNETTLEAKLLGGDKVEIGDREAIDFKPHLKLNRWDGECFIKVALPTTKKINSVVEGNKTKWVDRDIEAHLYPLEPRTVIAKDKDGKDVEFRQNELGSFEFEVILKKKPKTNKIVLNIETQGLKFYYQPPLTQQEIDDGCIQPENVVGSYAVYHATRTNIHRSKEDAEKYKCGKAFHIYRPKIIDAEGNWVWGELLIDEKAGTLTISVGQDWLDKAVYPVVIDPNFGYEVAGGTAQGCVSDDIWGTDFTSPADTDTGVSITAYVATQNYSGAHIKGILVLQSNLNIVANGVGNESASFDTTYAWITSSFGTAPSISPSTSYVLALIHDFWAGIYFKLDSIASYTQYKDTSNDYDSPTNPTDATTTSDKEYSIYCTYTAAGGQDYPISISCSLSLTASIDRDVAWNRATSSNLSLATTISKSWGRLKTISSSLSLATAVSRAVAYTRATSSNLSLAVNIVKSWGRTIATSTALSLATAISRVIGYKRAMSSALSLSTSINRVMAFGRAVSSGLTLATTVVKSWGRTITSSASLSLSTTVSRAVAYSRATSSNLSLAVSVARVLAYARATSSNLSLAVTVIRTRTYNKVISVSLSLLTNVSKVVAYSRATSSRLSLTPSVSRAMTYARATSANLSLAVNVIKSWGRTITTSCSLSLTVSIIQTWRKFRNIASFTNLRAISAVTGRAISAFTNLRTIVTSTKRAIQSFTNLRRIKK